MIYLKAMKYREEHFIVNLACVRQRLSSIGNVSLLISSKQAL